MIKEYLLNRNTYILLGLFISIISILISLLELPCGIAFLSCNNILESGKYLGLISSFFWLCILIVQNKKIRISIISIMEIVTIYLVFKMISTKELCFICIIHAAIVNIVFIFVTLSKIKDKNISYIKLSPFMILLGLFLPIIIIPKDRTIDTNNKLGLDILFLDYNCDSCIDKVNELLIMDQNNRPEVVFKYHNDDILDRSSAFLLSALKSNKMKNINRNIVKDSLTKLNETYINMHRENRRYITDFSVNKFPAYLKDGILKYRFNFESTNSNNDSVIKMVEIPKITIYEDQINDIKFTAYIKLVKGNLALLENIGDHEIIFSKPILRNGISKVDITIRSQQFKKIIKNKYIEILKDNSVFQIPLDVRNIDIQKEVNLKNYGKIKNVSFIAEYFDINTIEINKDDVKFNYSFSGNKVNMILYKDSGNLLEPILINLKTYKNENVTLEI